MDIADSGELSLNLLLSRNRKCVAWVNGPSLHHISPVVVYEIRSMNQQNILFSSDPLHIESGVRSEEESNVTSRPRPHLTVIDLFAGCGGLSLGLEEAGFSPVFVNELNRDALQTYLLNRRSRFPHLEQPRFHVSDVKQMTQTRNYLSNLRKNLELEFGIEPEGV